jgi:high-affinity nickel permease
LKNAKLRKFYRIKKTSSLHQSTPKIGTKLGLKNRLRLISLFPIIILISITSYFVYDSYENYKAAQILQDRLSVNRELNELINNISRERGMTVMYLGDSSKSTLKALNKQRKIVDAKEQRYVQNIDNQIKQAM